MTTVLESLAWQDPVVLPVKRPEWEAPFKKVFGVVPRTVLYAGSCAWFLNAMLRLVQSKWSHLPSDLGLLVRAVAALENSCRYCYGTQRSLLVLRGASPRLLDEIEGQIQAGDASRRAIIDFVRRLARSTPRPARAEAEALLALGHSPEAIAEMACNVAESALLTRVHSALAIPPERDLEKLANGRFLKRIVSIFMGGALRPTRIVVEPEPTSGPFAAVIDVVTFSPRAKALRHMVDEMLASPTLPQRAKALMMAVVARGLGCSLCESEARALLIGLADSEIDRGLANLVSPSGDTLETDLMVFARDTVRYRVGDLQDRTRLLAAKLGPERTVEAVAVAGAANALVRLAMLRA